MHSAPALAHLPKIFFTMQPYSPKNGKNYSTMTNAWYRYWIPSVFCLMTQCVEKFAHNGYSHTTTNFSKVFLFGRRTKGCSVLRGNFQLNECMKWVLMLFNNIWIMSFYIILLEVQFKVHHIRLPFNNVIGKFIRVFRTKL